MGRAGKSGTSWRRTRALTFVFLGLLLASPLSSGDKGLWLSLTATPVLVRAPAGWLPAEHSTVLPESSGRTVTSARIEQSGAGKRLGPLDLVWTSAASEQRIAADTTPTQARRALVAARPDPRAPPA